MSGRRSAASRTAVVLGVPVDDVTLDEAVERIGEMVERGRATGRTHQVATINTDFVVNALRDDDVLEVLQRTDLSIPDGMPVVWAARWAGTPIRERTAGADLLPALAGLAGQRHYRLVLFGGAAGIASQAAARLAQVHPGAQVVGIEAGSVGPWGETADDVLDELVAARPDIVGVALGNPKQEHWIARNGLAVGAPVCLGIGGTLDFLTSTTRRAPTWMRDHGLEWLHRASSEPSRLAMRYARDLYVFGPALARQLWAGRRVRPAVLPEVSSTPRATTVTLRGSAPASLLEPAFGEALRSDRQLEIDAAAIERFDTVTLSAIVGLVREARRHDMPVSGVAYSAHAGRRLVRPSLSTLLGSG